RRALDRAGERGDVVDRVVDVADSPRRDEPVGRLDGDDATESAGNTSAPALVDTEREVDLSRRHGRPRAAGRAPGRARRIRGVAGGAEGARLAEPRRAEVVHVQLSDDRAALGQDALD